MPWNAAQARQGHRAYASTREAAGEGWRLCSYLIVNKTGFLLDTGSGVWWYSTPGGSTWRLGATYIAIAVSTPSGSVPASGPAQFVLVVVYVLRLPARGLLAELGCPPFARFVRKVPQPSLYV